MEVITGDVGDAADCWRAVQGVDKVQALVTPWASVPWLQCHADVPANLPTYHAHIAARHKVNRLPHRANQMSLT